MPQLSRRGSCSQGARCCAARAIGGANAAAHRGFPTVSGGAHSPATRLARLLVWRPRAASARLTTIPRRPMHRAVRQDRIAKNLIAASATALLLAILQKGPSYGYAIIQEVRALSGGDLEWSDGMLY